MYPIAFRVAEDCSIRTNLETSSGLVVRETFGVSSHNIALEPPGQVRAELGGRSGFGSLKVGQNGGGRVEDVACREHLRQAYQVYRAWLQPPAQFLGPREISLNLSYLFLVIDRVNATER